MKRIAFLAVIVSIAALRAVSQDRVASVEKGLLPPVVMKGQPVPRHTIAVRMKALNVNGVSITVVNNYEIEWAKGYGYADANSKRPVDASTLFQAGSISKPVAAVGAMKLVEQGKLRLDDDINNFLRSWRVPENEFTTTNKVTLRRIMSHSAGLTVHGFPGYAVGNPLPTVPQILDGAKPANTPPVRVDVTPGTLWRYSGGGYTIMQLAMTDTSGKNFPDLLKDLVLSKAGMSESTYENPLPARQSTTAATGYHADGAPVPGRYHSYPEMAAAGLWTTPSDLARFCIEMQKSREGRSNRILKTETVAEMLREQKSQWGLGFALSANWFAHDGADDGFQALFGCSFDGKGFVVMTNSDNGGRLAQEIRLAFAAAYGLPDKPEERQAITLSEGALQKFAGEYVVPVLGKITLQSEGNHLLLLAETMGRAELYPTEELKFFSLDGIPDITFTVDQQGAVTGFSAGAVQAKRVP
jgi:CubicO group peptidase (beta-lactamase class C family)